MARLARYAWCVLIYNLAVIAWGAYVRATGSGAGCGAHWPLCNGEVIVRPKTLEMLIEFSHRATSGLALISVVVLFLWARRITEPGHPVRTSATPRSCSWCLKRCSVPASCCFSSWRTMRARRAFRSRCPSAQHVPVARGDDACRTGHLVALRYEWTRDATVSRASCSVSWHCSSSAWPAQSRHSATPSSQTARWRRD